MTRETAKEICNMFEKEAEEYVKHWIVGEDDNALMQDAFKDGAEFGYNKANEWHCVKNDTPPEDVPLLCVRGGKIYVAWYWDNIYHDSKCCQVKNPYAWKEIVLPKECK